MPWPKRGKNIHTRGRVSHRSSRGGYRRSTPGQGRSSLPKLQLSLPARAHTHAHQPNIHRHRSSHNTSHIQHVGNASDIESYPVANQKCEKRLSAVFGKPYQNILWKEDQENEWNHKCILHTDMKCSHIDFKSIKPVERGIAMNPQNGCIVIMSLLQIYVFIPSESCKFTLKCTYKFNQFEELKDEDVAISRIRFVGDQLFVFSHSRTTVFIYKICGNNITLKASLQDNYFRDSQTVDIAATHDLLFILFDRWCGVYKLRPTLEWYHAIAFSKETANHTLSLEMNIFDDAWDSNIESFMQLDENHTVPCTDMRKSNKNYMIINTEHSLIGVHPSNPSFDFLYIADIRTDDKTQYCLSKHYGIFYTSNNSRILMQSPHLMHKSCVEILDLNVESSVSLKWKFYPIGDYHDSFDSVVRICNLIYDETYGISGRLLLFCESNGNEYRVHQMVNYNELVHFSDVNDVTDFYSVPGVVIVYVFQMLFGDQLIQHLLCSRNTNAHLNVAQSFQYLQETMRSLMKRQCDNHTMMRRNTDNIQSELYSISLKVSDIEAEININGQKVDKRLDCADNKLNSYENDSSALHSELLSLKHDIECMKQRLNDGDNTLSADKMRLKHWMQNEVKLAQYFDVFLLHGIEDLDVVTELRMDVLQSIGIDKIGHRLKIMKCVKRLKHNMHNYDENIPSFEHNHNHHRHNGHTRAHSPPMNASSSESNAKSVKNAQNYCDSDW